MNLEKHQKYLNIQKYESIVFAMDYIRKIRSLTGEINDDDFYATLKLVYEGGFSMGRQDVLDRTINSMFHELDEIDQPQE